MAGAEAGAGAGGGHGQGAGGAGSATRIVLPGTFPGVRQAVLLIVEELAPAGLDDDTLASVQIVVAEALNNIVEHAYGGETGVVEVVFGLADGVLGFTITDRGRAMPDGVAPLGTIRDYPSDPMQMPEGGFGWFLIHDLSGDLSYQRDGDRNILKFTLAANQGG